MSLGAANSIALAGLRFTSLGTRVVAENLANSDMAGYGLRKTMATGTIAPGVVSRTPLGGVVRDVDPVLLASARRADTVLHGAMIGASAQNQLEQAFGLPGDPGSLNTLMTNLEASLHQAAAMPDSPASLQAVALDAERIATKFNAIGDRVQQLRQEADSALGTDITALNAQLQKVADLNKDIQKQTLLGTPPFALIDERERVISDIATLLPVQEIARENNRVMLVSQRGEVLVDLDAAEFGFTATPGFGATDTRGSGTLSAIWLNGRELGEGDRTLSEGRLGANLTVRDDLGPQAQDMLDTIAMDLLTRFAGPAADSSLGVGELGLFGIATGTSLPTDPTGVSQQLRVHPAIDASQPEELWRLPSGLNATMPGPSLDPGNLTRMISALSEPRALAPGLPETTANDGIAQSVSRLATNRLGAESVLAYAKTSHSAHYEALASRGVDTDAQMQDLLKLERAYAANARVLTTLDDMLRQILEI